MKGVYKTMLYIRLVEKFISEQYVYQQMRCPVHLSIGQELPSALFGSAFISGDKAVSSHRAHAHYLASGGCLDSLIAELYGKATGCTGGKGGSMHLADRRCGFVASTAIVGNSIPLSLGIAKAMKLDSGMDRHVVFVFFGDGATECGAFGECLNLAAAMQLPIVFVCENNKYSVYTSLQIRQSKSRDTVKVAEGFGMASRKIPLGSLGDMKAQFDDMVDHVRNKQCPGFIEIETYRFVEHCGPNSDDNLGYRPAGEIRHYADLDPLIMS